MQTTSGQFDLGGYSIPQHEIEFFAIRAQGAGGQNVNKVSSAMHLRFDIKASSLPDDLQERLLQRKDHRINKDGVIVIKAQRFRTQEKNRFDALERLDEIIRETSHQNKVRKATRPSRSARKKRVENKVQRGKTKALRGRINHDD